MKARRYVQSVEVLRAGRKSALFRFLVPLSLVGPPAETFLIEAMRDALPLVTEPGLRARVKQLLRDESLHRSIHEPLNKAITDLYPCEAVRATQTMLSRYRDAELPTRIALGAAYEYIVDSYTTSVAKYVRSVLLATDTDESTKRFVADTSVAELFLHHAREENAHRDVAFEVLSTLFPCSYAKRIAAYLRVTFEFSLHTSRARRSIEQVGGASYFLKVFFDPFVRETARELARYFHPSFHPLKQDNHALIDETTRQLAAWKQARVRAA